MTDMSIAQREKFLSRPRMAVLSYVGKDGAPIAVPVWFEWDGRVLRLNTSIHSPKLKYLRKDPRISLVAGNMMHEPEGWVAFHGSVNILEKGSTQLGERLMVRYWPVTGDPVVDARREGYKDAFRKQEGIMECYVLEMVPTRVKAHWEFEDPGDAF